LWNSAQLLAAPEPTPGPFGTRGGEGGRNDELFAADKLLFGASFVAWTPVDHPLLGPIEVGGAVKQSQRVPPPFMIEELCHRNAAFVIHHADQMPMIVWDEVKAERLGPSTWSVTATLRNKRLIPSIAAQAARRKVGLPDNVSLTGQGLSVVAGGLLRNQDTGELQAEPRTPARIALEHGVGGFDAVKVRWFVRGDGVATLTFRSQKAGQIVTTVALQ
jgi:hypothetical protein